MILPSSAWRVGEQLLRGVALLRIVEDRGIAARHLPGVEERRPVDPLRELGEIEVEVLRAGERGRRDRR